MKTRIRKKQELLDFCKSNPGWNLEWCLGIGHDWYWLISPKGKHVEVINVDKRALSKDAMKHFKQVKASWGNRLFEFQMSATT